MTKKIQKPDSKPSERNLSSNSERNLSSNTGTALATKPLQTSTPKSPLQPLATNKQPQQNSSQQLRTNQQPSTGLKKGTTTRIIIKYDVGFPNILYIRGKGSNLSWERGTPLKNIKPDEWLWECDSSFALLEFKILINDKEFEIGNNHTLTHGSTIQFTPKFQR
jgi:hypothetical protein